MPDHNVVVSMPAQVFTLARRFGAAVGGAIYVGKVDTDPYLIQNRIPVYIENEDGSFLEIQQPVYINAAGNPSYQGRVIKMLVDGAYSMKIFDSFGVEQYYFTNVMKFDPDQFSARLASYTDGAGDALVGVKQPFPSAVGMTQHDFNALYFNFAQWGVVADGTDQSAKIQKALDEIPNGSTIELPRGSINIGQGNIQITKGVRIKGSGFSQASSGLVVAHTSNPHFKAVSVNNVMLENIYFDSSVTRTNGKYLDFVTCHRFTVQGCFFWNFDLVVDFNGGTEINFVRCEGFTNVGGTGRGVMWFGKQNYTGSINLLGCYFKIPDEVQLLPEFGVRFGYIDVAYIDGSTTIIRCGHDVEIVPGSGQFAHLIKIVGGILDVATGGLFVQPTGGADVEVELIGSYSTGMTTGSWIFDATNGEITANITGGQIFSNGSGAGAIDVIGAGAYVNINGTMFANNQLALHGSAGCTIACRNASFGDFLNTAGNQFPFAFDSTVKGVLEHCTFRNNLNPGTNLSPTMKVWNNFGVSDWKDYVPTVVATGGMITTSVVRSASYKVSKEEVTINVAVEIVANGTGSGQIDIGLPAGYGATQTATGQGIRIGSNGKALIGDIQQDRPNQIRVRQYDGTYPLQNNGSVATGDTFTMSITYRIAP